jgi:dienelactone hydrolase
MVEVSSDVARYRFKVRSQSEIVPGYLWTGADGPKPRPLVLLGHGATASKDEPLLAALAQRLVVELGFAAAAIDFPFHGERRPEEERALSAFQVRKAMGLVAWRQRNSAASEQAVSDLRAAREFLSERDDVDAAALGYFGLSTGTRFGIPFVAAEPRVQAAVFGLFGWSAELRRPDERGLAERSPRFAAAAKAIQSAALFLMQWDDELIPRPDSLKLFDLLGSTDKTLHANPGGQAAVLQREVSDIVGFFGRRLQAS